MNLIANVDLDWGIGRKGQLLVHLSDDMRHFRALTLGKVVFLGRKTLETFPGQKPLADRLNIIMTRNRDMTVPGAHICHDWAELAQKLNQYPKESVYIIGGASLYRQLMPFCQKAYITKVHRHLNADAFMTNLDQHHQWHRVDEGPLLYQKSRLHPDDDPIPFQFCQYDQDHPEDFLRCIGERGE
jgi:dihydrofolate reductase